MVRQSTPHGRFSSTGTTPPPSAKLFDNCLTELAKDKLDKYVVSLADEFGMLRVSIAIVMCDTLARRTTAPSTQLRLTTSMDVPEGRCVVKCAHMYQRIRHTNPLVVVTVIIIVQKERSELIYDSWYWLAGQDRRDAQT